MLSGHLDTILWSFFVQIDEGNFWPVFGKMSIVLLKLRVAEMIQRKSVGHLVASESTSSNLWDHCHPSRSRRSAHLHEQIETDGLVNVKINQISKVDVWEDLNGGKLKMSIVGDPFNSEAALAQL